MGTIDEASARYNCTEAKRSPTITESLYCSRTSGGGQSQATAKVAAHGSLRASRGPESNSHPIVCITGDACCPT